MLLWRWVVLTWHCSLWSRLLVQWGRVTSRPVITQTPDIFSLADAAWKQHKHPCFCILPLEFGVNTDIYKHENNEVLCSNPNKSPKEMAGNSRLQNMEHVLIDFILLNVQAKYLIQTILYHFKWDVTLCKWPKCPEYMQRTWWQTVATHHTGLT